MDIDEYDTMEDAYRQLIVWSPEDGADLGGDTVSFVVRTLSSTRNGKPILATSHLFNFSEIYQRSLPLYGRVGTLVRGSGVSIHPVPGRKAYSCWITLWMDWGLYPWLIRA